MCVQSISGSFFIIFTIEKDVKELLRSGKAIYRLSLKTDVKEINKVQLIIRVYIISYLLFYFNYTSTAKRFLLPFNNWTWCLFSVNFFLNKLVS